jgi:iron complex outermembrane receptor protein
MKNAASLLACTAIALCVPGLAFAQDVSATPEAANLGGIEDIIVTARRTEESLQDVPVAVTGFNSAQIEALDISSFADIGKTVPNLDVQRQFGSASSPQFFLRGVSTGSLKFEQDAGIGLYIDGVYLGRPAGTAFDLAEIERIEVLRGPQGTLFGRNSTGGAINYITAAPKGEFGVKMDGTIGNYDRYKGRLTIDLPALGPLTARVSYLHDENRGYVRNLTPGVTFDFAAPFRTIKSAKTFGAENTDAVAVALRLDLDPLVVDYKFDYTDKVSTQLGQQLLGFNPGYTAGVGDPPFYFASPSVVVGPSTKRQSALALDFTSPSHLKIQGHSLTAVYDISDQVTLKSITGYRKLDEFVGGNDIDGGAYVVGGLPFTNISSIEDRHQKQFSQEVQLLGNINGLEWVLGGFYFRETGNDNNPVFIGVLFPPTTIIPRDGTGAGNTIDIFGLTSDYFAGSDVSVRNKSYAGYAHLAYKTDHFELAGGVRYTKDKRREVVHIGPSWPPAETFNATNDHWDFDATATYIFNPEIRAYARFATGYLSGGVLGGIAFKPETVKSYEAGVKGDFLDNTLRINAAAFHTDRKNVQTLAFSAASGTFVISAPSAEENGFELELTAAPDRHLTFNASFGYLDQTLADDPVSGLPVSSLAPKFTLSTGVQYDAPSFANGSYLSARVDAFFKDKRFSDPLQTPSTVGLTTLPSRTDINARLSLVDIPLAGTKAKVSAWVQNLTDNQELEFARDLTTTVIGVFQVPRTYGLDVSFQF